MSEPKYKNLKDLAKAFASGELNRDHYKLILDNDGSQLEYFEPLPEGVEEDSAAGNSFIDEKNNEAGQWYSGNGYEDLAEAVEAAGIPCDWC